MTFWIGNGAVLESSSQWQLRTAPLPIHKVINNCQNLRWHEWDLLFFVNKHLSSWELLGL